jgi:hypothetical protein
MAVAKGYIDTNFPGNGCLWSPAADFNLKKMSAEGHAGSDGGNVLGGTSAFTIAVYMLLACVMLGVFFVAGRAISRSKRFVGR